MCVCWLAVFGCAAGARATTGAERRRSEDDAIMMMHASMMIDEERKVNKAAEYDFVFLLSLNTSNAKQGLNLVVSCDACMISFEPIPFDLNTEIFQATQFFIASLQQEAKTRCSNNEERAEAKRKSQTTTSEFLFLCM